jgi:hypothetical protein
MSNMKPTSIILLLCLTGPLAPAFGDDKTYEMERWDAGVQPGVASVNNDRYTQACGSCHFLYQPGLLPAQSWEKLMAELPAHFTSKINLSPASAREIRNYLLNSAAGRVNYQVSKQIMNTTKSGDVPTKVTATAYFVERHNSVTPIAQNFSNCIACHQHATEGAFK